MNESDNLVNNECIICFEKCNEEIFCFCKKCKNQFHLSCYKKWIEKCKEKGNNCLKCLYCQNYKTIYRNKKFCCGYYYVKML